MVQRLLSKLLYFWFEFWGLELGMVMLFVVTGILVIAFFAFLDPS